MLLGSDALVISQAVGAQSTTLVQSRPDIEPDATEHRGVSLGHGYLPALDGLRAIAVVGVMCFHAQFAWASAGLIWVSVFFALSGFLMTRNVLAEIARDSRVNIVAFWGRRVRRLAPAALVCLALVLAARPWFAASGQPDVVTGDIVAALGHVANWRFVAADQSYADLFLGGPSPVLHFWSLAIEEQFFFVFPIVIALSVRLSVRSSAGRAGAALSGDRSVIRTVTLVLGSLAVVSLVTAVLTDDHAWHYYGTHARAVEFLVGCLAAVAAPRLRRRWTRWLGLIGAVAIAALVAVAAWSSHDSAWLYNGGLAAVGAVGAVICLAASQPGPLATLLGQSWLAAIGRRTYGLYLFHWPVFQILTPDRTALDQWPLFALRLSATAALAEASLRLIEQPIRTRRRLAPPGRASAAWLLCVASLASLAWIPVQRAGVDRGVLLMATAPDEVVRFEPVGDLPTAHTPDVVASAPTEPLDTVGIVLFGDPALAEELRSFATSTTRVDVILPADGCYALTQRATCSVQIGNAMNAADAVLVAPTAGDSALIEASVDAALVVNPSALVTIEQQLRQRMSRVLEAAGDRPVFVISDGLSGLLRSEVLSLALNEPDVSVSDRTGTMSQLARLIVDQQPSASSDRQHVLVIGDSGSFGVATALNASASDDFATVWAGYRNCPLVPASDIRWWDGAEFSMDECLQRQAEWPQLLAEVQPAFVLAVASLTELSDQRYGDDAWHSIGDPEYDAIHQAWIETAVSEMRAANAVLVLFTVPPAPSVRAERVDAWNVLVRSWDATYSEVVTLDLAAELAGRGVQSDFDGFPDGIHLQGALVDAVVDEWLVPHLQNLDPRSTEVG
jgi:peptidoglycan/LPS O-acetylase OafA/YrhL